MAEIKTDSSPSASPSSLLELSDAQKESLKTAGFSEEDIHNLIYLSSQSETMTSGQYFAIDKTILDKLRYSGELNEQAKQIVLLQTPFAMLKQLSDPNNWEGDTYKGPGLQEMQLFLADEAIDFTKPSLDALMMGVLISRAEIIESQLREQISSIQEKNTKLEEMNYWLTEAKKQKANAGDSGTATFSSRFKEYWDSIGATYQSGTGHKSADWDVNIEGLKKEIEALTSQSQLETTKLQQTINKYNQTYEMLSNFISKYYQSLSSLTQNLRG